MLPPRSPSRRGVLRGAALAGLAGVGLSACAGGDGPRRTDSVRIILGHGAAPGNPRSDGALAFQRLVAEKSNDEVEIQILGQESVGSDTEMMVSVAAGTLDMTINSQGPFSSYVPEAALIGLPFLFETSQHAFAVLDGEIQDSLAGLAETKGFHVLGFWDNGMRDITNSVRPLEVPEDVAGLKIRTPDDPMTIDIFRELGANPTPMAFGELYLGLRQGAVDGQENPVVNIHSSSLHEVQEHLAVTGHKYEMNPFVISTTRWEGLDPAIRTVIEEAAVEAQQEQRSLMLSQSEEIYAEFEEILQVTHPDRALFREATLPVHERWQQQHPEFFDQLTAAAESLRAEHQESAS
ncbi:TRAP transporter substrate-binding protein [Brachybacterium saurashtrense]|uniref:TRAP transporter substrate-binding protein n=1 Tax=Brachybacterium saurashtrense TaxID=556288 RepID=A0A345YRW0_9MICO|nr:TRAP transporter substrate-binding protein [Brachybacterium saurashtrense]AXK46662.1 TRAP transporter substrate-binding protein [Brachybacterium saurashtrense]RRR22376.1 TRAP transporter substrate-binding protein [Brachybacterium saurashtrense]